MKQGHAAITGDNEMDLGDNVPVFSAKKKTTEELKKELLDKIGDYGWYREVFPTKVLVAVYVREQIGSILMSSGAQKEDVYQGKAFLVLRLGASAFKDTESISYYGFAPKVGDWVEARPADGEHLQINGQDCRIFSERDIRGILDHPDGVF